MFFEAWELFRDPALAGAIAGAVLGLLGVYVVLRRMVFLSAAITQAAGLGVAAAFYVQIQLGVAAWLASPTLGATVFTLIAVAIAAAGRGRPHVRIDSLLGLAYLVGAAGTLAVGTRIVQEIQDIQTLLFGSAVAVLPDDLRMLVWLGGAIAVVHAWWWRGFSAVSFDPDGARVRRLPVRVLEAALLISLALAISAVTRVLGALPAFAFSVLPAMAAVRVAPNVQSALVLATLLGGASGFLGYLAAFLYELPVGATQALVGVAFVLATAVWARGSEAMARLAR
jgi:zinc transport system permease protein